MRAYTYVTARVLYAVPLLHLCAAKSLRRLPAAVASGRVAPSCWPIARRREEKKKQEKSAYAHAALNVIASDDIPGESEGVVGLSARRQES